ncbi:MAG: cbb3-type cytochrome c oxidase subunit I, partial [SAR202 cluster bacterium]|nr:cbb3-type cytochrome c oxidase subunit I [SAR202 cluster bacterium]
IFLADVATDVNLQDTYFVVAHFHYTMVGGEIFMVFGAIYYWFPKVTGRMYNESLGKLHFWWMFIAYNVTFIAMFLVGIAGMNRRVAEYPEDFVTGNIVVSIASFVLGVSFVVFVFNMIRSWIKGPLADANPWRARTLEWQTSSPPPHENFNVPPVVTGHPYDYGVPGSIHADMNPSLPSSAPAVGDD